MHKIIFVVIDYQNNSEVFAEFAHSIPEAHICVNSTFIGIYNRLKIFLLPKLMVLLFIF